MPTYSAANASHWIPQGVNPPCRCPGHDHRPDERGMCDVTNDNNPESWGFCPCQNNSEKPVTMGKYREWRSDIAAGKIGPNDHPEDLGISY